MHFSLIKEAKEALASIHYSCKNLPSKELIEQQYQNIGTLQKFIAIVENKKPDKEWKL